MKVLVAEDDPLAAQVIEITASTAGIAVEVVPNGLDAADRIAAAPADHYAAVLLDMRMPIMDGREAARRIRDLPPPHSLVPIYAMSANEAELLRHPWATWLFDGHLTKPLTPADFMVVARGHVAGDQRAKATETDQRNAILDRLDRGTDEIEAAIQKDDFAEAGDAARRMRLALLGLVSEDLIRALHVFQLSQIHGRREEGALRELRQCVAAARTLLMAA